MKKILNKLGIYTINDFACTIGGFLICILIAELFVYWWFFELIASFGFKTIVSTLLLIVVCRILDIQTK